MPDYGLGLEPGRYEFRCLNRADGNPAPPDERRLELRVKIDRAARYDDGVVREAVKAGLPCSPANNLARFQRQRVKRHVATLLQAAPNAVLSRYEATIPRPA